jgi:hypothetical protein
MNASIRWRIIILQAVAVLVFAGAAYGTHYAATFTQSEIHDQLAPQQIYFPPNTNAGLPDTLAAYAGQQVLTGDQAHAYAEKFIGLHLSEIGQGHPYSYWSGLALTEKDPTKLAQDNAIANTLFKGETLKSLLNEAYAFSVFGQIAYYAMFGLIVAAGIILAALLFELAEAYRARTHKA